MKAGIRIHKRNALLSDSERELILVAARGLANKEIADAMGLSVLTVKATLSRIYKKLGVRNRNRAIIQVLKMRLVDLDEIFTEDELTELLASIKPELMSRIAQKASLRA